MEIIKMAFAITGSSGFVGKRLVAGLKSENHSTEKIFELKLSHRAGNPYTPTTDCLAETTTLVALGAWIPKSASEINHIPGAVANILNIEALVSLPWKKLKRICYVSTIDVYDPRRTISESTTTLPQGLYGWSKLFSEKLIKVHAAKHGIESHVVRLGHVYGPGEESYQKLIPNLIRSARFQGSIQITTSGSEQRSFIHVDDAARGLIQLFTMRNPPEILNLVGEESIPISKISEILTKRFNLEIRPQNNGNATAISYNFDKTLMTQVLGNFQRPFETGLEDEINQFDYGVSGR